MSDSTSGRILRRSAAWAGVFLATIALGIGCGEAPPPVGLEEKIFFEPGSLEFGEIFLEAGFIKMVEVENRGRGTVTLTAVDLPEGFEVSPSQVSVPPGEREELRIRFRANRVGLVDTSLRFRSTARRIFELPVRAQAVTTSLAFEPEILDFGPVPVGETRKLPVKVRSLTDGNLDLHVSLRGAEFQGETGIIPLGGRQTIELELQFTPTSPSEVTGWLQILPCQGCLTLTATLVGEGRAPRLQAFPRNLEFGAVHPPLQGVLEVQVRNEGNLAAWVAPPLIDGSGASAFSVLDVPEPFLIEVGEEETIRVGYVPGDPEGDRADLRLVTAESAVPLLSIPLQGESGGALLQAETVEFGPLPGGRQELGQALVRNVGTAGTPRILAATIEGKDAAHFSLAPGISFPMDVAIGEEDGLPLDLLFEAGEPGTVQVAELVLTTSHRFQPTLRVPLVGRVARAECELEFETPELRFGLVGTAPRNRSVRLHQRGTGECFVWALELHQEGEAFALGEGGPEGYHLLRAGAPLAIPLRYTGNAPEGWSEGQLQIRHSSDGAPPLRLDVTAFRHSSFQVSHTPEVLRFQPTPIGNLSLLPVEITQTGPFSTVTATFTGPFRWEPLVVQETLNLGTGTRGFLPAAFVPQEPGLQRGEIAVKFPGVEEPYRILVEGTGEEECSAPCKFPSMICSGPASVEQGENLLVDRQSNGNFWACRSGHTFSDGRPTQFTGVGCFSSPLMVNHFQYGEATQVRVESLGWVQGGAAAHCEVIVDILPPVP